MLKQADSAVATTAAFEPLKTSPASQYVNEAAPDVTAMPADHPAVAACALAIRNLGRASAEADLCRQDVRDMHALLASAAQKKDASHAIAAIEGKLASLPSDVRGILLSNGEWEWARAELGERRAFVAGVMGSMDHVRRANLEFGALDRNAPPLTGRTAAAPQEPAGVNTRQISREDVNSARSGSGRRFDASLGKAGRHGERDSLSIEELEAADRAEAAATIAIDIPGVTAALTTEGFIESVDAPVAEGAYAQASEVRAALAYCSEYLAHSGGSATLGKALTDALKADFVPETLDFAGLEREAGQAGRPGGAIGNGLSVAGVPSAEAAAFFAPAPAPPRNSALFIIAAFRAAINSASAGVVPAGMTGRLSETDLEHVISWRRRIETHDRAGTAAASWVAALPGGTAAAMLDSVAQLDLPTLGPSSSSSSSAVEAALASRAESLGVSDELIPGGSSRMSGVSAGAVAGTIAKRSAQADASPGAVPASVYAAAHAQAMATGDRSGLVALLDDVLTGTGAGGLAAAAVRTTAAFGDDWSSKLEQMAVLALMPPTVHGEAPLQSDPASPEFQTAAGLLPANAFSADEVVLVATHCRVTSIRELASRLGVTSAVAAQDGPTVAVRAEADALQANAHHFARVLRGLAEAGAGADAATALILTAGRWGEMETGLERVLQWAEASSDEAGRGKTPAVAWRQLADAAGVQLPASGHSDASAGLFAALASLQGHALAAWKTRAIDDGAASLVHPQRAMRDAAAAAAAIRFLQRCLEQLDEAAAKQLVDARVSSSPETAGIYATFTDQQGDRLSAMSARLCEWGVDYFGRPFSLEHASPADGDGDDDDEVMMLEGETRVVVEAVDARQGSDQPAGRGGTGGSVRCAETAEEVEGISQRAGGMLRGLRRRQRDEAAAAVTAEGGVPLASAKSRLRELQEEAERRRQLELLRRMRSGEADGSDDGGRLKLSHTLWTAHRWLRGWRSAAYSVDRPGVSWEEVEELQAWAKQEWTSVGVEAVEQELDMLLQRSDAVNVAAKAKDARGLLQDASRLSRHGGVSISLDLVRQAREQFGLGAGAAERQALEAAADRSSAPVPVQGAWFSNRQPPSRWAPQVPAGASLADALALQAQCEAIARAHFEEPSALRCGATAIDAVAAMDSLAAATERLTTEVCQAEEADCMRILTGTPGDGDARTRVAVLHALAAGQSPEAARWAVAGCNPFDAHRAIAESRFGAMPGLAPSNESLSRLQASATQSQQLAGTVEMAKAVLRGDIELPEWRRRRLGHELEVRTRGIATVMGDSGLDGCDSLTTLADELAAMSTVYATRA
jgi:hypothetical protein